MFPLTSIWVKLMADFNVVGMDELIEEIQRHQEAAETAIPKMLNAGAEILKKAQKQMAQKMKIRDSGDFIDSIGATPIKTDKDGNKFVYVYPQGTDRHGVRNAEVGFIAEYGTSKIKARPWMRTANEKSADEALNSMKQIWDEESKGG